MLSNELIISVFLGSFGMVSPRQAGFRHEPSLSCSWRIPGRASGTYPRRHDGVGRGWPVGLADLVTAHHGQQAVAVLGLAHLVGVAVSHALVDGLGGLDQILVGLLGHRHDPLALAVLLDEAGVGGDDREEDAVRDFDDLAGLVALDGVQAGAAEALVLLPLRVETPRGGRDIEAELVEFLRLRVRVLRGLGGREVEEAGALLAVAVSLVAVLAGAAGHLDLVRHEGHDDLDQLLGRQVVAGLDVLVLGDLQGEARGLDRLGEFVELTLAADDRDSFDAVLRIAGDGDVSDQGLVLGDDELEVDARERRHFLVRVGGETGGALLEEVLDDALGLAAIDQGGIDEDQLSGGFVPGAVFGHDGEAAVEHMEVGGVVHEGVLDGTVDLGLVAGRRDVAADVLARVDVDDLVDGGHPGVDGTRGVLVLDDGEVAGEQHFHAVGAGIESLGGAVVFSHIWFLVCLTLGAM